MHMISVPISAKSNNSRVNLSSNRRSNDRGRAVSCSLEEARTAREQRKIAPGQWQGRDGIGGRRPVNAPLVQEGGPGAYLGAASLMEVAAMIGPPPASWTMTAQFSKPARLSTVRSSGISMASPRQVPMRRMSRTT